MFQRVHRCLVRLSPDTPGLLSLQQVSTCKWHSICLPIQVLAGSQALRKEACHADVAKGARNQFRAAAQVRGGRSRGLAHVSSSGRQAFRMQAHISRRKGSFSIVITGLGTDIPRRQDRSDCCCADPSCTG